MGTLLIDLSNGVDLEKAVRAYENIMAPANYKRPTALITKKQIEAAQKKVEELGLIGTEANLRYFEKVTPNYIDCGTDVDKFINTCLQFK